MADRYDYMQETLDHINGNFIRLKEQEVFKNTKILKKILDEVIALCKEEDELFRKLYQDIFYGGNFYDGVRIGQPEEFDLQLKLKIPKEFPIVLCNSNIPGYVNLKIITAVHHQNQNQYNNIENCEEFRRFRKQFVFEKNFMSTRSVHSWMEGILDRVLDTLNRDIMPFNIHMHKNGPALTLKIRNDEDHPDFIIDVDLVPCFIFEDWPANGFIKPDCEPAKKEFFAVPKAPKKSRNWRSKWRYWRLSFQPQEREMMNDLQVFKPTFKFLKKLRDRWQLHPIASYYIKNVMLSIIHNQPRSFWNNSLSYVFMTVLKTYEKIISSGNLPYYWYKKNNLLENIKPETLENMGNKLRRVVKEIDDNIAMTCLLQKTYSITESTRNFCDTTKEDKDHISYRS